MPSSPPRGFRVEYEPHHRTTYPVTGHFHEGPGYGVRRMFGAQDWLLIVTVSGRGRVEHREGGFLIERGDVVLLPPNQRHEYGTAEQAWELLWAHFVPPEHWAPLLDWPAEGPDIHRLTVHDPTVTRQIIASAGRAHRLAGSVRSQRQALAMNALEAVLLWCAEQHPDSRMAGYDPRIRAAIDFATENLAEPISVERLAAEASLSPSRFAHLFREQVGQSPQQFVEQRRLLRARQLLERTAMRVYEVAEAVGFTNPVYFSRRFRAATGRSPRAYRQAFAV